MGLSENQGVGRAAFLLEVPGRILFLAGPASRDHLQSLACGASSVLKEAA